MHTSLLDHGNSVMQKIAPPRERVGEGGGGGPRFLRRLPSAKKYEIYDNSLFHLFYSLCSLVFSRYVTSSSILFAIQTLVLR